MRAYERLLRYVQFDTVSDPKSSTCPSTKKQFDLARALVEELKQLGLKNARVDETCYVYATLPKNTDGQPSIGLIAHMDVSDAAPTSPVNASLVPFDGKCLTLQNGDVLTPEKFPGLSKRAGKTLMVTDGKTLLGADDKAGIAEIMTCLETLAQDPSIPHGDIQVAFTPDEEIGRGADKFDVPGFGAEFAYTVDGGDIGSIEYENFNAASGVLQIHGVSIHPGSAKDRMINALNVAFEFHGMLPPTEVPEHTEGYEGFFHLSELRGGVENALMHYIIRDHDMAKFTARKELFAKNAEALNRKYGEGTVDVQIVDSYFNMKEALKDHMHVVRRAEDAFRAVGVEPFAEPIRGGTDGCRLSYMGLPCPNLPTGGLNAHGRHELIAIEDMDKMVEMLVELVRAK
ncbi:MAG TPA: peptidase T [Candidatus Pullichristensenella excrementigallinarum]|uniref:Peptidase T n=1 Tax=Candidatus Pullichristensenella excrementigallinarum TaxID=2840907 RepID=A0A9D1LD72_9FIRM|nr:peptidase T [Candidatus Pullichristensenella excrementigallinarum]